ncbi:ergothioneine biosynthesis protein EgtB [Paraliomyxa miuraensis]|uniref:ergothioneine biosynthesis protein EgtB n=1 Tax=Paraliomyxa miuraensis TaxID=376150 RepID=UPI00224F8A2F|nr:ergothioneine biosynthesis protein EgtB [Paraliomyxa miuraensis]MCX4244106.1 ergothioneine biosynthesis protein EgtB [Paraliomyxa miuraensis]
MTPSSADDPADPIDPPARALEPAERYAAVRAATRALAEPLELEDYGLQSMPDASPVKWHLAHTTWFFETFVLERWRPGHEPFHPRFGYLFNSYYESVGRMHPRPQRGLLTRPTVAEVWRYREHVDAAMQALLDSGTLPPEALEVIEVGLQHEQQHQELVLTDLKHGFWCNPLWPAYREPVDRFAPSSSSATALAWLEHPGGLRSVGFDGAGFAFDNERPRHRVYLEPFALASRLVTCGEFLEFMADDGYRRPELWLSAGFDVVRHEGWRAPLYWLDASEPNDYGGDGRDGWRLFTLAGARALDPNEPVCHLSYYEADAFARWRDCRLPTEAEWEQACADRPISGNFVETGALHPLPLSHGRHARATEEPGPHQAFGDAWEWTASGYAPYPGFRPLAGSLGEYNGKFMCNQLVLRGGSCATPASHVRTTYRNFFPPQARWQFSGLRLARDLSS